MRNWLRKLATLGVAVIAMLVLAVPAFAATTALPDETSPRTLTIYKYDTIDETAEPGTGTAVDVNTSVHTPLSNVIFDVYYYANLNEDIPSSVSLSEAEKWIKDNSDALVISLITNENGEAVWEASKAGSAADGVYLVAERTNRAIQVTETANPFFISLPYTNVKGDSWIYDVAVQPKNNLLPGPEVDKDVLEVANDHAGVNANSAFAWIIRGDVPADLYYTDIVNGTVMEFFAEEYKFTVSLAEVFDYYGNVSLSVYEDGKVLATLPAAAFTVNGTIQPGKAGGELTVSLTELGMKAIMSYVTEPENAEIHISYETTLNETAEAGVEYYSNATLSYTNSTSYTYEPVSVPEAARPEAHTGGFRIEKVEKDKTDKKLEGAKFHIALTEADAENEKWLEDGNGKVIELITDKDGLASYVGLAYDSTSTEPQGGTYYWLVEVKAPKGYRTDKTPARFTVNAATYDEDTEPYQILNELDKRKKPSMPHTGNTSSTTLWGIGIFFVLAAGVFAVIGIRSNRRSKT